MTIKIYSQLSSPFFFCIKHRSLQTTGTQRSLISCYSEALCSPATPQHILWWEMTLLVSYPTDPSPLLQRMWEQLVSPWKLMRQHKASSEKKVLPLLLLAHTFPHPWKAAVEALAQCTAARYLCCCWDGEAPAMSPSRTSSCAFATRPCSAERDLSPWQRAPSHSSSALSYPLHYAFIFARPAKNWNVT